MSTTEQTIPFATMKAVNGHTAGPWLVPHFARDDHPCQCKSVVGGHHSGAICTVEFDNGITLISEGGNDAPPLEEAKANARLISAAPDMLAALRKIDADWAETFPDGPDGNRDWHVLGKLSDETAEVWRSIRAAIAKATAS